MDSETTAINEVLSTSKRLPLADQLLLISLISERLRRELKRDGETVDMLPLAGLGEELWRGVDVDAYLEQERASWNS